MAAVHILQGLPGAGKTTFASRQFGASKILCSADQFLVDADGAYRFSPERVQEAHASCLRRFVEALQGRGPDPIVVDNTNLTVAEMAPYVAVGQAYGASVRIWHLDASAEECIARQTHWLPVEAFPAMWENLAAFSPPPWWPTRTTLNLVAPAAEERAYLAIAVDPTNQLSEARARICSELGLLPRTEAHVTLAFIGRVTSAQCKMLADELAPHVEGTLGDLVLTGTGAAYEPDGAKPLVVERDRLAEIHPHACVAWWSVASSAALKKLSATATSVMTEIGLPPPEHQPFRPHVTLGSCGRAGIADADFDVYSIEKEPTLGRFFCPDALRASKVHVTSSKILPASFACLRAW